MFVFLTRSNKYLKYLVQNPYQITTLINFLENYTSGLLSCFSCVQLCATPQTAAHQAPPSLGFSRREHWSGLPFPLQCRKVKSEREAAQSCPTLSDPMDCSLPDSSVHGDFPGKSTGVGCHCLLRQVDQHIHILQLNFKMSLISQNKKKSRLCL